LYVAVGFRQFSNFFNKINSLLSSGEVPAAREQLRQWRNEDASELDGSAVARVAIELGLMQSHRNVFAPVAWFLLLGPAGALFYRMADIVRTQWYARAAPASGVSDEFARFAARAFAVIDWIPIRLTAASFAAAGNFQDAVDCWRSQASAWADPAQGIILASGAGALGVRLGGELQEHDHVRYRPELGTGDDADADHLSSAVGLIWRTMVMWMLLLTVVTIARLLG
jgi:adenosylcobinamide-phosphate synthase